MSPDGSPATNPVEGLFEEEEEFQQALVGMDEALRTRGSVGHRVAGREIALGRDVLACSSILRTLHGEATKVYADDPESQGLIVRFGSRVEPISPADRLGTAFKILFLFVRAYQDAIYAVLYELQEGRSAGGNSSMRNAADKPQNPVGALVRERVPGYVDWFTGSRDLRNEIKEGANFGLVGPLGDLGVSVNELSDAGFIGVQFRPGRILKLYDATIAIGASKLATELARDLADGASGGQH